MTSCFLPRLRGLLFLGPLFLGAVPLLAGCGIPPAPDRNEDGAIAAGRGRIYFYRTTLSLGGPNSLRGEAPKPEVMLDERRTADAPRGGVCFCVVAPGVPEERRVGELCGSKSGIRG